MAAFNGFDNDVYGLLDDAGGGWLLPEDADKMTALAKDFHFQDGVQWQR